ncbi:Nitrilase [Balamuthia mandrillaris]
MRTLSITRKLGDLSFRFSLPCVRNLPASFPCSDPKAVKHLPCPHFLTVGRNQLFSSFRAVSREARAMEPETEKLQEAEETTESVRGTNSWIAVGQMTSTSDVEQNFQTCAYLIDQAVNRNCSFLCLPEAFDYIADNAEQGIAMAQSLDGPLMTRFRSLAKQHNMWLSLGGFHEKEKPDATKIYNTHVIIDNKGEIVATYRKIHLFDVNIPHGPVLQESKNARAGNQPIVVDTPVGVTALSICYDLRFPELYLSYRQNKGAQVILIPSAFTQATGKAHWEPLLRARAIETQCYVVAAAQVGNHNAKRSSHGNSIIIDPWGKVVACCSDRVGIAVAEIDHSYMEQIREQMPVFQHRRPDVYGPLL